MVDIVYGFSNEGVWCLRSRVYCSLTLRSKIFKTQCNKSITLEVEHVRLSVPKKLAQAYKLFHLGYKILKIGVPTLQTSV